MNFEDYKAEDFLQDQSFLNFCLAKNEQDVGYWNSWIKAHPHKEPDVQQAVELYYVLNGQISAEQYREDENYFLAALESYKKEVAVPQIPSPYSRTLRWMYGMAAAAAIAGLLFYSGWFGRKEASTIASYKESSSPGERRSFQLSDGSVVMLNSGSTLEVAENFNREVRELTLNGEAYFEVAHNTAKPFIVHTANMEVKVLGTVFNVRAFEEEENSETALLEGSVEVTLLKENNRKVLLSPNEKIIVSATGPAGNVVDPKKHVVEKISGSKSMESVAEISWTKNRLVFNDENFISIAHKLERWFNVKIEFETEALKTYRFTATFDKKTIGEVLEALKLSRPFNYTLEKDNIYIITK